MTEDEFTSEDGPQIVMRAGAAQGTRRAVVAICHGLKSHSGQYGSPAAQLAAQSISSCALDLRGSGQSEGGAGLRRAHRPDARRPVEIARERHPELVFFLPEHSAGDVVACTFALDRQDEIDGLICEICAFQVPAPGFVLSAIKALSHLSQELGVLTLKMKGFARDPDALAALGADPLTKGETQPASSFAALVRADERLHDSFGQITLPLLIRRGIDDRATVCRGSAYFHAHTHAGSA